VLSPQLFLEGQNTALIRNIQSLVSTIRDPQSPPLAIRDHLTAIATIAGVVVKESTRTINASASRSLRLGLEPIVRSLEGSRAKVLAAEDDGDQVETEAEWKEFIKRLPPIAFDMAKELKKLLGKVESITGGAPASEDFA
jgi:hypothetical protein